jgi:hypothetical protein
MKILNPEAAEVTIRMASNIKEKHARVDMGRSLFQKCREIGVVSLGTFKPYGPDYPIIELPVLPGGQIVFIEPELDEWEYRFDGDA